MKAKKCMKCNNITFEIFEDEKGDQYLRCTQCHHELFITILGEKKKRR